MVNLLIVILNLCALWSLGRCSQYFPEARRCCPPTLWEADVEDSAAVIKEDYIKNKNYVRLAFDWVNRRWALRTIHANDTAQNFRLFHDHKQGWKYAWIESGCIKTKLSGHMNRFCPAENSSYDGLFSLGFEESSIDYNVWSHEINGIPIRSISAYTADSCYPFKFSLIGLVQNNYEWKEGEPSCVPWAEPAKVKKGRCYKTFSKKKKNVRGVQLMGHYVNMSFRNVRKRISPDMFADTDKCTEVEEFTNDHFQHTQFIRGLIHQMKYF